MTIAVPYRGIIEIVGDHDTGKTIAALQTAKATKNPLDTYKKVVFVDDDVKGEGTVRQMKNQGIEFDEYLDLSLERSKLGQTPTADELLKYVVLPTIDKINEKKREIVIWDTWRIVYQSARGHVERNQQKYSNVVTWRGTNSIIQGLISKVARMIESKLMNDIKANCDLLVITHHIKDNYVTNVMVGKIPESSATFSEVCNMRMWLRRNQQSKVPIMLFLKRPSLPKMTSSGLKFVNIVPLKITPTAKHETIWEAIAEYEAHPIESRMPREDETPTPDELAAISGTLSPEQKKFVEMSIEYNKHMEEELSEVEQPEQSNLVEVKQAPEVKKDQTESKPQNLAQLFGQAKAELDFDLAKVQDALGLSFAQINEQQDKIPELWQILVSVKDKELAAIAEEKSNAKNKAPAKSKSKK